jgi:hypothetical protein
LFDDELVVADLTDYNPNVFYELAVRHATHRPIVQIIRADQRIPFDLVQQRTIKLDHTDLDSAEECRNELIAQIRSVETDPTLVDNPISQARRIKSWEQSTDPEVRRDAEILGMLQTLNKRVDRIVESGLPLHATSKSLRQLDTASFEATRREARLILSDLLSRVNPPLSEDATAELLEMLSRMLSHYRNQGTQISEQMIPILIEGMAAARWRQEFKAEPS